VSAEHEAAADAHTRADREFHEATAHLYDSTLMPIFGVYYDVVIGRLLDEVTQRAPGRDALDLGCGTGGITIELARRGLRVQGLDHSPAMMRFASERLRDENLNRDVTLSTGDVRALRFDDESFDIATCQGVLHHLEEPAAPLNEIWRVLRPGGMAYIAEPCQGSTLALRSWLRARALLRLSGPAPEGPADVPDHDEGPIDQQALISAARDRGFEVETEFWTQLDGLERLPAVMHRQIVKAVSRPWRHRSGNMLYLIVRKPA
jgi:ubiquinone/menaquinone biosynthesis C-methylase UbiE